MDRIFSMLFRMLFSRVLSRGVTHLANRGKDPATMTPEERSQAKAARVAGKRARQALRIGLRFGR